MDTLSCLLDKLDLTDEQKALISSFYTGDSRDAQSIAVALQAYQLISTPASPPILDLTSGTADYISYEYYGEGVDGEGQVSEVKYYKNEELLKTLSYTYNPLGQLINIAAS